MKPSSLLKAACVVAGFSAAGLSAALAQECSGPFAGCARDVAAVCSIDPDGVQRITYWDNQGNSMVFQRCVGNVYVSRGFPNPYDSGNPAGNSELPFPRTTLNYPAGNP